MADKFDPYHKWLAIPPKDQPPHHYRLLGLDLFESDPEVIEAAADRIMAYVQGCATGPHTEASQKLLNEIATARVCLLHPQQRVAYDATLKHLQAPPKPPKPLIIARRLEHAPAPPPPAFEFAPIVEFKVEDKKHSSHKGKKKEPESSSSHYKLRKSKAKARKQAFWVPAAILVALTMVLGAVGAYVVKTGALEKKIYVKPVPNPPPSDSTAGPEESPPRGSDPERQTEKQESSEALRPKKSQGPRGNDVPRGPRDDSR